MTASSSYFTVTRIRVKRVEGQKRHWEVRHAFILKLCVYRVPNAQLYALRSDTNPSLGAREDTDNAINSQVAALRIVIIIVVDIVVVDIAEALSLT